MAVPAMAGLCAMSRGVNFSRYTDICRDPEWLGYFRMDTVLAAKPKKPLGMAMAPPNRPAED